MADGQWINEREALPGTHDLAVGAPSDGEEGRLLAAALTAALLEYCREVQSPDGGAEVAGPGVAWRLLARWEQMAPGVQGGGWGRP